MIGSAVSEYEICGLFLGALIHAQRASSSTVPNIEASGFFRIPGAKLPLETNGLVRGTAS